MELLMSCVVSILQMLIFTIYLKELLGFRRPAYWIVWCWFGLELVSNLIIKPLGAIAINALSFLILLCIIVYIMCKGSWKKKIFITVAYVIMIDVVEVILVSILIIFKVCTMETLESNTLFANVILILNQMLVFILFRLFFLVGRRWIRIDAPIQNWLGIFFVSISCFAAMFILALEMFLFDGFTLGKIAVFCILLGLNFLSYYFYTVSAEKNRIAAEAKAYQKQVHIYREWYEGIKRTEKELSAFRHDVNNHFHVLQELCRNGEERNTFQASLAQASQYIEDIGIKYQRSLKSIDSGNMIIDSIIDAKRKYAASKGIVMTANIAIPQEMECNGFDMVVLFGNLLDNAIEACEKIPQELRLITLTVSYRMKNLLIDITNSYDGQLDGRSGRLNEEFSLNTTKEDAKLHGIGFRNIRGIVDKYKGGMRWKAENGIFQVEILLYEIEEKQE